MEDHVFQLKFMAKSLARQSIKSEKEAKASKNKCKKALEKGNEAGAKIYAQNVIRQRNEALNYLHLSSRVDAVAARVNTAAKTQQLTKAMGGIVKGMDKVLSSMNLEQISTTMDKFEQQFQDLDVRAEYMDSAMGSTSAMTTPDEQVQSLMQEVADEHHLEFSSNINSVGVGRAKATAAALTDEKDEDADLEARLKRLTEI